MRTYINMRKIKLALCLAAVPALCSHEASAQYRTGPAQADSLVQQTLSVADTASAPVVITLEQALQIALSENVSVKVADQEIQRSSYAKKGVYASLFPQIDLSGTYQRTIKKQVMYMDLDMGAVGGGSSDGDGAGSGEGFTMPDTSEGLEVGRWNTWAAGLNATMPLVNPQLWKSMKISGLEVEMAIEKARSSRLDMVTQVKQAYFGTLLAKEVFQVYRDVYENAVSNYRETEKKFNAQKATEYDLTRAKTSVANAIPEKVVMPIARRLPEPDRNVCCARKPTPDRQSQTAWCESVFWTKRADRRSCPPPCRKRPGCVRYSLPQSIRRYEGQRRGCLPRICSPSWILSSRGWLRLWC